MEIVKSKEKLISPTDTISQTQTRYSYKGGSTCDLRLAARGFLLQFVWTTETSYMTAFCTICWVSPHAVPLAGITGLEL